MIAVLAFSLSCQNWNQDSFGIWHGPSGSEASVEELTVTLARDAIRRRLNGFLRLHPDSELLEGDSVELGIRHDAGSVMIRGIVGKSWVMANINRSDWRFQLSLLPNIAAVKRPLYALHGQKPMDQHSSITLINGNVVNLPPRWCWLDEKLGMAPVSIPDTLVRTDCDVAVSIRQYKKSYRNRIVNDLARYGLSEKTASHGFRTSADRFFAASVLTSTSGWIVLCLEHPTPKSLTQARSLSALLRVSFTKSSK